MDLQTKREIARRAIVSITTHVDETRENVVAEIDIMEALLVDQRAAFLKKKDELDAAAAAKAAAAAAAAEPAQE